MCEIVTEWVCVRRREREERERNREGGRQRQWERETGKGNSAKEDSFRKTS